MGGKKLKTIVLFTLLISLTQPTAPTLLRASAAILAIPDEVVVPGFTPYSEIPGIIEELNASDRVLVQVIGQSVNGYDLYLATVANPAVLENLNSYKEFAKSTVENPNDALKLVEEGGIDYKATIFITGSQHGNEMMGTDACLDLIELLANQNTEETLTILDNTISLIYLCVNPDGRIANIRENGNYFDLNRDWLTASQPEVRAGIEYVYKEWAPLVNIDLHGYIGPDTVLIEPCTPLHNPNAEEDLEIKNLLPMAEKMETALKEIGINTIIPYRDWTATWDDYPPIFAPMYGFYRGTFGLTFESTDPYNGTGLPETSISAQYCGTLAAYEYIIEHKNEMFEDQTQIFVRGIENENHWLRGQYGNFPYAYILPMDPNLQMDPIETARMVDNAIFHGVKVQMAQTSFTVDGVNYPAGTYVVPMNQPMAGLAMNMFWYGEDTSAELDYPPYDTYAWNFPEVWGFTRIQPNEAFSAKLKEMSKAVYPSSSVGNCGGLGFALKDDTNNAIAMVNKLLKENFKVYSADCPFEDDGERFEVGTFIIPLLRQQKEESFIIKCAKALHLELFPLNEIPLDRKILALPKVAILSDVGVNVEAYGETQFVLKTLGFNFDAVKCIDVQNDKLKNYDIVIIPDGSAENIWNELALSGQEKLLEFIRNGGTYFGMGEGGGSLVNYAKFLDATAFNSEWGGEWFGGGYNNAIVRLSYDPNDPIAAYYPENSYAYAFFPVYFSVGENVKNVASYASDNLLLAGWWPNSELAEGYGAVIRGRYDEGNVILCGVAPAFRAHTEFTFRLLANAIFFSTW